MAMLQLGVSMPLLIEVVLVRHWVLEHGEAGYLNDVVAALVPQGGAVELTVDHAVQELVHMQGSSIAHNGVQPTHRPHARQHRPSVWV